MKNHLLSLCMTLFLIFAGGMTAGCDKLDDKYKSEKTITLTIASVKPAAADDDYDWLQGLPVYIYKEESPDWRLWYSHDPIRGFDEIYEEGYEYVVKVRRLTLAGPPQDAGAYVYELKRSFQRRKRIPKVFPNPIFGEERNEKRCSDTIRTPLNT